MMRGLTTTHENPDPQAYAFLVMGGEDRTKSATV